MYKKAFKYSRYNAYKKNAQNYRSTHFYRRLCPFLSYLYFGVI